MSCQRCLHPTLLSILVLLAAGSLVAGWWLSYGMLLLAAAAATAYLLWRAARQGTPCLAAEAAATAPPAIRPARAPLDPADARGLALRMIEQGRAPLLLRPQIAETLDPAILDEALRALHEMMAFVPEGEVELDPNEDENRQPLPGKSIQVGPYFLDRYPMTNEQYYEFVSGGGYEQMGLWDEAIWPAVLDFVDRTGKPGPRYWREGCFLEGQARHPVVGVSWYEAAACARWFGKRLPSDAEWVKAGAWPVPVSDEQRMQRRYPWGDVMDRGRANLWGSHPAGLAPVEAFPEGVSIGGVYQLIGNVWEWTWGNFHRPGVDLRLPYPMKTIRGGAFDTYFDNQATCQFRSGENPLARRHNIGFRTAIAMRDLVLARPTIAEPPPLEPLVEEHSA